MSGPVDVVVIKSDKESKTWSCQDEAKARSRQAAFAAAFNVRPEAITEEKDERGILKRIVLDARPISPERRHENDITELKARVHRLEALVKAAGLG